MLRWMTLAVATFLMVGLVVAQDSKPGDGKKTADPQTKPADPPKTTPAPPPVTKPADPPKTTPTKPTDPPKTTTPTTPTKPVDPPKTPPAIVPSPVAPGSGTYFPTKIGTTWTYKIGDKRTTTRVAKIEKRGTLDCVLLETVVDGNVLATEHIIVTKDALKRVAYNGQDAKEPLTFLKLPAKKGDTWDVDTEIGGEAVKGKFLVGEEEVTVPWKKEKIKTTTSAGDFKINGQDTRITYWINDQVGIVKLQMSFSGQDITLELEKFEEGK